MKYNLLTVYFDAQFSCNTLNFPTFRFRFIDVAKVYTLEADEFLKSNGLDYKPVST